MFGIGLGEILIIFLVALLVFGPEKMPAIAKQLAGILGKFRAAQNELRYSLMQAEDSVRRIPNEVIEHKKEPEDKKDG